MNRLDLKIRLSGKKISSLTEKTGFLRLPFLMVCCFLFQTDMSYGAPLESEVIIRRHNYIRGEQIPVKILLRNPAAQKIKNIHLEINLDNILKQDAVIKELAPGESKASAFNIATQALRSGDYKVSCMLKYENEKKQIFQFPVSICKRVNPDRLPVFFWIGGGAKPQSWKGILRMKELAEHGINLILCCCSEYRKEKYPIKTYYGAFFEPDKWRKAFDDALKYGMDIAPYFYSNAADFNDTPGVYAVDRNGKHLPGLRKVMPCPFEPAFIDFSKQLTKVVTEEMKDYPSFKYAMFNSEFSLKGTCQSARCRQRYSAAGFSDPLRIEAIKNGIIEDSNEKYRFPRWWWQEGLGDNLLNEQMARELKKIKPEVITWSEPFRDVALYNRKKGLDCLGDWCYCRQDPKRALYIETLIAAAKPEKQKTLQVFSLFCHPGF
ncbi:MAG: hypothetical protein PHV82_09920, partial [Victivallaceae bacterium]|nr:hypothetical protein [Victivallaceae bacterium]